MPMEKHGNTWFPGDPVRRSSEKYAANHPNLREPGVIEDVDADNGMARVKWAREGVTTWIKLEMLERDAG